MNYSEEVNAFYDWLETNPISDSAIVLWHALMHINSKAGWKTEFAVAISTLSTKTGLKKDAIGKARNRLQQAERIRFSSRSGQQSAIYTIIPFASEKQTLTASQTDCVVLTDTNSVTKVAQTASQTAHKQPPLDLSIDLKDIEKDKDRLRHSVFEFDLQSVGAFGLDEIYSYLGVVDADVIELAIKRSEKKPLGYFKRVIDGWISEGKTSVDLIFAIPPKGEATPEKPRGGRGGYSKKPEMKVVRSDEPAPTMTPEEEAEALERIRRLKNRREGKPPGGDDG